MERIVIVIGGGPAGLSAAEVLAEAGCRVTVVEALGSPARKFLRAGVGGLNLTHSQPLEQFLDSYGPYRERLEPFLRTFGPEQLRAWAAGLGVRLFTGSSGRIFPEGMAAGPLVKAWMERLDRLGVRFETETQWTGWDGERRADAVVLALGGPTWPALGTGGSWTSLLTQKGLILAPWKPANCGWETPWTPVFRDKFAGQPLKETVLAVDGPLPFRRKGELMITSWGLEGGLLYAAGAAVRAAARADGAPIVLDIVPGRSLAQVQELLSRPRQGRSLSTHLAKTLGLVGAKAGLLREVLPPGSPDDPARVAALLKALPLRLTRPRPLDEAISAAGGVLWEELTPGLQLRKLPGVWCAGEMIDWEAPTGGYLLTACFSLGRAAARNILETGTLSHPVGVTLTSKELS